ncbi:MAG TPA: hypothetical protein VEN81_05315, partial [Planctomycetota bacterium]|nr:hypothetical protein [Planctomycetota bacterium]
MGRSSERGYTLVEILVVLVFLVVVVALLTPAFGRVSRQHQVEACAAHLKTLHAAQQAYYARGGPAPELGRSYWEKLAGTTPPLIPREALHCPLV